MQVANPTSLSWLRIAAPVPGQTDPAGSSSGQSPTGKDVTSTTGQPPSLASLLAPSQLFSADSLNSLIAAQAGSSASGSSASTSSSDPSSTSASTTSSTDPADAAFADPAQTQTPHRHHHPHGGGDPLQQAATNDDTAASTANAATASASAETEEETDLSQLLATL